MSDEPYSVWTTARGQEIPVAKMTTSHLCNALAHMRRALEHHEANRNHELLQAYGALSMLQGEAAIDAAESAIFGMESEDYDLTEEACGWIDALGAELERRSTFRPDGRP